MMHLRPHPTVPALALGLALLATAAPAVNVHPDGVNVRTHGATTVFLTFGGLSDQVAAEGIWCGELQDAAPDLGQRCDPATIFGRLPARFDLSRPSGQAGFTDIMSIPPSVSRRAFQAARAGSTSSFFYVRRFVSTTGGPDEFVPVTCRLAGGGARVPLALTDVEVRFETGDLVRSLRQDATPPPIEAEISYNGTGRLQGRWEIVKPGEELPRARDLFTEGTLPAEERSLQRRFTQLARFNVFLPPTGRVTLPGPPVDRLPTDVEGPYQILLRVEASAEKESTSSLAAAGAGNGAVRASAVAGFPMPVLRYYVVGASGLEQAASHDRGITLLEPPADALVAADGSTRFRWTGGRDAVVYRFEVIDGNGEAVASALLRASDTEYRSPPWIDRTEPGSELRWRVVGLDGTGAEVAETGWRPIGIRTVADP